MEKEFKLTQINNNIWENIIKIKELEKAFFIITLVSNTQAS